MAQFARPDSNVTQTSFTNGFAAIDEATASDADFAYGANNTAAELEVGLSNVTDPASSSGHVFRYRIAKTNAGTVDGGGNAVTVTVRLMQGTTQIATDTAKTADGTWTQYAYTLSAAEADAITDYTDLRLEFVTSASGGSPANRRGGAVSWAELEVPDASSGTNYSQSLTGALSFAGAITKRLNRALTSGLSFSGAVAKQVTRPLTSSVGFSGSVAKRIDRSLSGTVTFTSGQSKQTSRSTSAAVSFTVAFVADLQGQGTPALVIIHYHTE